MPNTPRIGSLFSGYGGLDMGVQLALGGTVAWHCEFDDNPSKILAHHWPDVPNLGDITAADWTTVEPVDILTGGYPCQPFSHAGQRRGTADTRHLWPYVVEAMSALRPRMAVFENVQGHLTLGFDQVLRDLSILGYAASWVVISAASIGAPHRRNRLFILAEDTRGQLRGRTDRRRGLHRHPGSRRVLSGAPQGVDVGQGHARTPADAADLRREDRPGPTSDGRAPRVLHVAPDRDSSVPCDRAGAPLADGEGRTGGHRTRVSGDGGRLASSAQRSSDVDGRDAAPGVDPAGTDSGSEPPRPGPRATASAEGNPGSGLPLGRLVGTGAGPVRPGRVHGPDAELWTDGGGARLLDHVAGVDVTLLPSPRTSDTNGAGAHGQGGMDLRTAVTLLPTPVTTDAIGARNETANRRPGAVFASGRTLGDVVFLDAFGDYAPAIARWETVLGRPAPAPTEPTGKDGGHRLSPRFVEWLMGLPAGHVTNVPGLSRNAQLKALGNGVVPQQAAAAITHLLNIRNHTLKVPA